MIILDTDHLTVLKYLNSERCTRLESKLVAAAPKRIATTVVNVEEQVRGWMASIGRERSVERQVAPYREFASLFGFFAKFHLALFDETSAQIFLSLRKSKIKLATMDLKIACVALANNALLLTANRRDFEKVPGLRFENWLD